MLVEPGGHDKRVMAAAEQARVQLRPRKARVFDEVVDIVNFDLVLVLDHFDLTEVHPGNFFNQSLDFVVMHCAACFWLLWKAYLKARYMKA